MTTLHGELADSRKLAIPAGQVPTSRITILAGSKAF